MSVTKEGIKGYEYQYKLTALISLLLDNETPELFVEIEGSEDALFKITHNGIEKNIEIQVKRENKLLNFSKLIEWLCHFQERISDNNLLSRITNSPNSRALFVTKSRCNDDIVKLKTDFKTFTRTEKIEIDKQWKDNFNSELLKIKEDKTQQQKERTDFCKKQANLFKTIPNLINVLDKVIIWEEISDEKIDDEILKLLNKKYLITISKTEDVYLKLLEIIKKQGRDLGLDVIPEISKLLNHNKIGIPNLDKDYVPRDEEQDLIEHLTKTNILLLSGISQCGKSETAKKIAHHFCNLGHDFLITSEIEEIQRFFNINQQDEKISILEDPFDHFELESIDKKRRIENLIKNSQSHHKLIITSKKEILFELFKTNKLNKCNLAKYSWIDLTIYNSKILNNYWFNLATKQSFPQNLINSVSKELLFKRENDILQYGQLSYLLGSELSDIENKSIQEIEHIARSNSNEIAISIKSKDSFYSEILAILALCSNTIQSICFKDLAYILSDSQEPEVLNTDIGYEYSFGGKERLYPEYSCKLALNKNTEEALIYLEERQLIETYNNKEIVFSHPNYFEAGRYCFFFNSSIKQSNFLKLIKRCLTCISPNNVFLTTKQFQFLYNRLGKNYQSQIVEYAFEFSNSIYPIVQDSCQLFLASIINDLDEEKRDNIIQKIQSGTTGSYNIYWYNKEIPYISKQGGILKVSDKINKEEFAEIDCKLLNSKSLNSYEAWFYLKSYKDYKTEPINLSTVKFLFQYREAFIRAKIYKYALLNNISNLIEFANLIFEDENPSVIFSAIRTIFMNWHNYSIEHKTVLFNLVKNSLSNKLIAIRTYNLLSTFSIDYSGECISNWRDLDEFQKKDLWNFWAKIYPIAVKDLPINFNINTARFAASMDDAIEYLDISTGLTVIETWYKRIDFLLKNGKLIDSFELSIAKKIMELTKNDFKSRKTLFSNLINYNDTNFVLSNLTWITNYWDNLDVTEKNQIIGLIKGSRKDLRWIKAVLLNSYKLHDEIVFEILGEKDLLNNEIENIVSKFPIILLRDCLNVFCGIPQRLWWLAIHHKNIAYWNKVIRFILLNENHNAFDICIEQFLNNGVNGFSNEWNDGIEFWGKVCNTTKNKSIIAFSLIKNTSNCTCNITTTMKLWSILFESYKKSNQENELITIIAENIEILQQTRDKEDLYKYFGKENIIKIIKELIPDGIIIKLIGNYKNNISLTDKEKNDMFFKIIPIIKEKPIRFFFTFHHFRNVMKENFITSEIKERLKEIPNLIEEIGIRKLEILNQQFQYELEDWIEYKN